MRETGLKCISFSGVSSDEMTTIACVALGLMRRIPIALLADPEGV